MELLNKKGIKSFLNKRGFMMMIIVLSLISVSAFVYYYKNGLGLAYNDSMAHMDIARQVFDNLNPGFYQLGSVWLPLNHVLTLPLVWNDWAWHSGFAGSLFSMISYVVSAWAVFRIVKIITKNRWAALLAMLVFALNLNMLYLQATPLSESLYLALFLLSGLYLLLWTRSNEDKYLILLGLLGFAQVLTRYDGWFVVGVEALLIMYFNYFVIKLKFRESLGRLVLFAFPVFFGVFLWIIWNLLIFGDPLYFIFGPYSAHAQQAYINDNSGLLTKGSFGYSVLAFWYVAKANVGILFMPILFLGSGLLFFSKKISLSFKEKIIILVFLLSPIFFNILSLYLGFSIVNMPELNWNPSGEVANQWFNVRYGILALPIVAILAGVFSSFQKSLSILVLVFIFIQSFIFLQKDGVINIIDGTRGASSFANGDVAQKLSKIAGKDEKILLSMSFFNPVAFKSGFPLRQFVHEGSGEIWNNSLVSPEENVKFVVVSKSDTGDLIYKALLKNNGTFLNYFTLAYRGKHANIYRLKTEGEFFATSREGDIFLGKEIFSPRGVNSYDLAYREKEEIEKILSDLSRAGVDTVRFWMFGDGFTDGFQPSAGMMNEERFKRVDFIIASAEKYNMRVIPTLVNNWDEYGGKKQYLKWTGKPENKEGLFYTDKEINNLFKNYINTVVTRKNSITGRPYSEEPAILAWDIANEPRAINGNNQEFILWAKDISKYLKSRDNNHLIMIGVEKNDPMGGVCAIESVDICSLHLYLSHDGKELYDNLGKIKDFTDSQLDIAKKIGKPIIVGEVGVSKSENIFKQDSLDLIIYATDLFRGSNYNGYLIWNWGLFADDSFGFSVDGYGENGSYNIDDLKLIMK